jgi:hypothetical protein
MTGYSYKGRIERKVLAAINTSSASAAVVATAEEIGRRTPENCQFRRIAEDEAMRTAASNTIASVPQNPERAHSLVESGSERFVP